MNTRVLLALAIGIATLVVLLQLATSTAPPLVAASPSKWHPVGEAEFQRLPLAVTMQLDPSLPSAPVASSRGAPATAESVPAKPKPVGGVLRGNATWYDYVPGGAAAGPGLRRFLGADWRGTRVLVSANGVTVLVRLTDWCWCPKGNRIVDLDDASFARLAPLGAGVIAVSVREAR